MTEKTIYLRHILHDQIECEQFWREQLAAWQTDEAGNTPEQQFEIVLEPATEEEYLEQEAERDNEFQQRCLDQESEM